MTPRASLSPSSQKNKQRETYRHRQLTMTEQQFTNALLEWAKVYGWRRFHVRNSGVAGQSIVQGDKGFPDLVLVKPPRLIFAELKVGTAGTLKGDPTVEQDQWLEALGRNFNPIGYRECYLWRPEQWSEILVILSKP